MLISGWDIANADARQWNVTPGFHDVKNESEWIQGSMTPAIQKNDIEFKPIKVTLLVKKDGGRQEILRRCSDILARLLEPVELTLDGFDHKFYGIMTKYSHEEKSMKRWHTLTIEMDGYEYADEISLKSTGQTSITVNNPGNIVSPAVVILTAQTGDAKVEITGICRNKLSGADMPVVIHRLSTGDVVELNGETGIFKKAGSLQMDDIEIWDLPSLKPGENKIEVSDSGMDIEVRFHPRFM